MPVDESCEEEVHCQEVSEAQRGLKETKHNAALEAETFAFRLFRIQHEE
jgi:hypothetical protein